MDKAVAMIVDRIMRDVYRDLNESLVIVEERCTKEEAERYRKTVVQVMGTLLCDVMRPIYKDHPELIPQGRGSISVP